MGSDIHAHLEIKVNDEWLYYAPCNILRNYVAFAKMANVRNDDDEKPIDNPRGLPDDVSQLIRLHRDYWGVDGHSDSWLTCAELKEVISFLEARWPGQCPSQFYNSWENGFLGDWLYLFGNYVCDFEPGSEDYPDFIQDVRLVFWFDN